MSDRLAEEVAPPSSPRQRLPRSAGIAIIVLALAAGALGVAIARSGGSGGSGRPTTGLPSLGPAPNPGESRLQAIRGLLRRRSVAIEHHDRQMFVSTIDPGSPPFRRSQVRMFANLAQVRFAGWSYQVTAASARRHPKAVQRYDAPTWSPSYFALHYRLAGFDIHPTDRRQYPTFVKRDGRWYLASLTDFARTGQVSATDLWDYAPVRVIRRPQVLVLGPPAQLSRMVAIAGEAAAAIPRVTAVWGPHWARKAVVLVPSTQREMGLIDSDNDDLDQIVALTSAEVRATNGHPAPVGDRITINPQNWPKLGPLGAAVVLAHELTHVATRADTGTQTPKWLSEGFAEYVGFRTAGVTTALAAAALGSAVQAGRVPTRLPSNHGFRGGAADLSATYQGAWLACRYIAERYGQQTLVRFYRAVGTSPLDSAGAVSTAMKRLLHLTVAQFDVAWHTYIEEQLG